MVTNFFSVYIETCVDVCYTPVLVILYAVMKLPCKYIAGACYSTGLRDKHSCIENSTKNSCPVCYEVCPNEIKYKRSDPKDQIVSNFYDFLNLAVSI